MSRLGTKSMFDSGRAHIRQINEDRARVKFATALLSDEGLRLELTEMQTDFLIRLEADHAKAVPDIHSGDRNICDSLRRKFQRRLSC